MIKMMTRRERERKERERERKRERDYLFVSKDDLSICSLESRVFKNGENRT